MNTLNKIVTEKLNVNNNEEKEDGGILRQYDSFFHDPLFS